jgi:hypothetical protein
MYVKVTRRVPFPRVSALGAPNCRPLLVATAKEYGELPQGPEANIEDVLSMKPPAKAQSNSMTKLAELMV